MRTKEQIAEYRKQYRLNNQETIKRHREKYKEREKENGRARQLRKRGITAEEFNSKLKLQDGKCAICDRPQDASIKFLSIDHDHKTNKLRGLLCSNCNRGIGCFKDDPQLLIAAAAYLK